jgi:hypothetical protein
LGFIVNFLFPIAPVFPGAAILFRVKVDANSLRRSLPDFWLGKRN